MNSNPGTAKTSDIMRISSNTISPMTLFWYLVYALALFLIFVAGIWRVARIQAGPPQKN
jgi:hypothetical protein